MLLLTLFCYYSHTFSRRDYSVIACDLPTATAGRGMVTVVTSRNYPGARDVLVNRRRTVTRVTNGFQTAADLVTPPLHTRFYIRDPRSWCDALQIMKAEMMFSFFFWSSRQKWRQFSALARIYISSYVTSHMIANRRFDTRTQLRLLRLILLRRCASYIRYQEEQHISYQLHC